MIGNDHGRKGSVRVRVDAIWALLVMIVVSETLQFSGSVRFVTLVASCRFLADLACIMPGKLRDAFLVSTSLAVGSIIIEGAALGMEPKISTIDPEGLYRAKSVVGRRPTRAGR